MGETNGFLPYPKGFATAVCHFSREPQQWSNVAMVLPTSTSVICQFLNAEPTGENHVEKSSMGHPIRDILEKTLAHLENGMHGICLSSGSSAISTCLSLLDTNDHLISVNDVFGGTRKQLRVINMKYNIQTTFVDIEPVYFERAVQPNTKMIWIETPTNPSLHVLDIEAISRIAKKHKLILIVDNTFLSPYLQRPLNFGADVCISSVSKYFNGHADVIMGVVVTNHEQLYQDLRSYQRMVGDVPSVVNCYQVLKSLKTLPLRMRRHGENSMMIAKYLENHPKIQKVIHPGLPSHPSYELTKKQTSGHSGMITIYLKGNYETTDKFIHSMKLIHCAGSLGDCASLIELPSKVSHASVPAEDKKKLNYTDNMMRLSVGLEDPEDLIQDLEVALAAI